MSLSMAYWRIVSSYAMTSGLSEWMALLLPPSCARTENVPTNIVITRSKIKPLPRDNNELIPAAVFLTVSTTADTVLVVF